MNRATKLATILGAAIAIFAALPLASAAQQVPLNVEPIQMPSPQPRPTVSGTPIPYPAYGTPAPDVVQLQPRKGVPTVATLEQSIKIAVALSPVFALENAQWAAIHAAYTSAKQAYLPGLSGTATAGKQYENGSTQFNGSVLPSAAPGGSGLNGQSTTTTENVGISVQQLIYDGGRTIANIRSTRNSDYAGRATLLRNLETLQLNVANAYYTVLQDNATVTADAVLVHEFEISEASVAAQIRNGAAARSDIAAAQFQTAQARGQLVVAQGQAIGAQAVYATTLGLEANAEIVPKPLGNEPAVPNPTYEASLARALLMRPDYISAHYSVEAALENLRYAKLARFPVLSAAASDTTGRNFGYDTSLPVVGQSIHGYSNVKTLGLNLTIPIYDQGQTNYAVAVAAAQLDEAKATQQQTKLTVESDVRSAVANLISARALLVQAHAELTAAQVSLDATQAQYKVGATTIINVTTAEANLATAQAAYISALYGVQTAEQNYLYATGVSDIQL